MALTFSRWLALAGIGMGIVAVAIMLEPRARPSNRVESTPAQDRARLAARQTGVAAGRLRVLQLRDSVRAAMGTSRTPTSRATIAADIEPRTRRVLESLVASVEVGRPEAPVVPVDLAFVLDTVGTVRGVARRGFIGLLTADYVLPRAASEDRCLVLARVKHLGIWAERNTAMFSRLLTDPVRMRLLGPCAYYERFGHPGPQIEGWLRQHGWNPGLVSAWDAPFPSWSARFTWFDNWWSTSPFTSWALRDAMTTRGFACVGGDHAACEGAVLDRPNSNARVGSLRPVVWSSGIVSTNEGLEIVRDAGWLVVPRELGPRDWTLLAEMVRTLGPERFARFWRSDRAPREAFHAAAGTDIGSWSSDWVRRLYGVQARGPGMPISRAMASLAVAALALGIALVAAHRRQVA